MDARNYLVIEILMTDMPCIHYVTVLRINGWKLLFCNKTKDRLTVCSRQ